jgi:broad specificity phosphatase PhoE
MLFSGVSLPVTKEPDMSQLILVRHGQASFLEANYDKLSQKGEFQSRLLGEYWAQHKIKVDRVYTGPRVRQKETARIAGEAYSKAGLPWPEPLVIDAFDEFQAEAVMAQGLPKLAANDGRIRALDEAFRKAEDKDERFRAFQRVFEIVINQWASGDLLTPGIEPWVEFCGRVEQGLQKLVQNGNGGQRIAVFSSGGPIGVAMQKALRLSTDATLRAAWMVRNCSYSEFLFSSERFTLSSYNANPHLVDPLYLTYR